MSMWQSIDGPPSDSLEYTRIKSGAERPRHDLIEASYYRTELRDAVFRFDFVSLISSSGVPSPEHDMFVMSLYSTDWQC